MAKRCDAIADGQKSISVLASQKFVSSEKKLSSRNKKRTYNESACCRVDTPLFKRIATSFQYELFESLGIFPTGWRKVRVGFVGVLNERLPGL